mmetsp:Transcript_78424/g.254077  ORF Transcript_78424/g.254077 Transcript_78424/m.254077 type:complete len:245 (-) Transcript_78424:586-1320(-)
MRLWFWERSGISLGQLSAGKPGYSSSPRPGTTSSSLSSSSASSAARGARVRSSPTSSRFSWSTSSRQPAATAATCSAAEEPRRWPLLSVQMPGLDWHACSFSDAQSARKPGCAASSGSFAEALAQMPVPTFTGLAARKPNRPFCAKLWPSCCSAAARVLSARQRRAKAACRSEPSWPEKSRRWSSSLTQTARLRAGFTKMPRASGQCLPMPEARTRAESGCWKRRPPASRPASSSGFMPPGRGP